MQDRAKRAARRRLRRSPASDPRRLAAANISPVTGLSTDYLNHFGEAIMLLDLAPQTPEYRHELTHWRPLTYQEYFAASQLGHRDLSIAAYDSADTPARRQFDAICATMRATIMAARSALPEDRPPAPSPVAAEAVARLKRLFARASAVVHGLEAEEDTARMPTALPRARRRAAVAS
jgi:hypothetical protein